MNQNKPFNAVETAERLANVVFTKRGNHSEVHLGRTELMAIIQVAMEEAYRVGLSTQAETRILFAEIDK